MTLKSALKYLGIALLILGIGFVFPYYIVLGVIKGDEAIMGWDILIASCLYLLLIAANIESIWKIYFSNKQVDPGRLYGYNWAIFINACLAQYLFYVAEGWSNTAVTILIFLICYLIHRSYRNWRTLKGALRKVDPDNMDTERLKEAVVSRDTESRIIRDHNIAATTGTLAAVAWFISLALEALSNTG